MMLPWGIGYFLSQLTRASLAPLVGVSYEIPQVMWFGDLPLAP